MLRVYLKAGTWAPSTCPQLGAGEAISMSMAAAWASETTASGASRAKVSVLLKGACAGRGAGLLRFKVDSSDCGDLIRW